MLDRLNHIAIVVPNLDDGAKIYKNVLGAKISKKIALPDHGVTTIFIELENAKIELLHPLGSNSPIESYLRNNPNGGIHHVCYEVENIYRARDKLLKNGARVLGTGEPQTGAHGLPVIFLHPKDFCGTLIELEESARITG